MARLTILGMSFLAAVSLLGQAGPAISEGEASFRYQTKTADISNVNFQEFSLRVDGKTFKLHQGAFKRFSHGRGGEEVELFNHWLLSSSQSTPKQALLYFIQTRIGGSSSQTAYIQLLSVESAHLVIKQEFRFIPIDATSACDFDRAKGELRIIAKSADTSPSSAPTLADHVFLSLNAGRFIRTGWQTVSTKLP